MTNDRRRTVPIIERLRFKSAKDFLTALHGTHDLWQSETARWIFRGHGDARWKLSPSAFRDQAWKQFEATYRPARCNEAQRTMIERAVIWAFGEGLDRAGLPLPGLSPSVLENLRPDIPAYPQWPRDCLELAALAQHHGVPTRLLDFTRHGNIAAYFAAQEPPGKKVSHMSVWAVDAQFLEHGNRIAGMWLATGRASRAANPNLHAQAGLFALWTGPDQVLSLDQLIQMVVDGKIRLASGKLVLRPPVMRKLTLPRSEAPDLLVRLAHDRITGATMFPGVEGVVRAIKEMPEFEGLGPWLPQFRKRRSRTDAK